jgi:hypothetical protein
VNYFDCCKFATNVWVLSNAHPQFVNQTEAID